MAVDLTTTYMGMSLRNPLVPSASPLSQRLDTIRRLEDAGASAVVMYSLFEEQVNLESLQLDHYLNYFTEAFGEALSWYPEMEEYHVGPEEYLNSIRRAKEAVDIPIIGSLNGLSTGGWISYAQGIEEAGADALEINTYFVAADTHMESSAPEQMVLDVLDAIKSTVSIPVAVKLSPFYSATAGLARRLSEHKADALVLFNRFYQPDLDLETLEVVRDLALSTSEDLRLPLRWVAILYGRISADLAVTSGVHTHEDVIKALMAGAKVAMMASELLQHGIDRIAEILRDMTRWMEEREYESVKQMRGSMSQQNVADPAAFERAGYMRVLQSWRPDPAGTLYRMMLD